MADEELTTSAPETTAEPTSAPAAASAPAPVYVVRSGSILHNGVLYKQGDVFAVDDEAAMASLIAERGIILQVEAQGMVEVGRQIVEKDAEIAALRAQLESLQTSANTLASGNNPQARRR